MKQRTPGFMNTRLSPPQRDHFTVCSVINICPFKCAVLVFHSVCFDLVIIDYNRATNKNRCLFLVTRRSGQSFSYGLCSLHCLQAACRRLIVRQAEPEHRRKERKDERCRSGAASAQTHRSSMVLATICDGTPTPLQHIVRFSGTEKDLEDYQSWT